MADTKVLAKVKNALGITGTYQDNTLDGYIEEVIGYMVEAGVPEPLANSEVSAGVISRGVADLWNYGNGTSRLSEYFYQRVTQLVFANRCGEVICMSVGDYGITYPVHICGVEICDTDTVTFTCEGITKTYTNIDQNCVLITFTKEESESFTTGAYKWQLKIQKDSALVTAVNSGVLIVS